MPDLYTAQPEMGFNPPVSAKVGIFVKKLPNIRLSDQGDDEIVYLVLRKHIITNFGWIIIGIVSFFIPFLLGYFPPIFILPQSYKIVVFIGWYLLVIAFLFEKFLSWFFNVGVITNKRIIDVDFYGLLYKEISDAELEKIQDVTDTQIGAIRAIFDFGNITIQTAGEKTKLDFVDVPHPGKIAKLLQDLRKK